MKKENYFIKGIKVLSLAAVITVATSSLISFTLRSLGDDFLKQLGLTKPGAEERIRQGILGGSIDVYGIKNLKNIAAGNRAAVANDILAYTKKYAGSADFLKNYNELREYHKPKFQKLQTPEEMRAEAVANQKKGIAQMEETIKKADAANKPIFEKVLIAAKEDLKKVEDPNSKHNAAYAKNYEQAVKQNQQNYDRQIADWEVKYPSNHLLYVKKRLQEFLNETADIDFEAELITKNGKKYFINRAYESKGNRWKLAFRAGKDVITTARTFAEKWVSEIK
jgi:predicted double-glycine peptidase